MNSDDESLKFSFPILVYAIKGQPHNACSSLPELGTKHEANTFLAILKRLSVICARTFPIVSTTSSFYLYCIKVIKSPLNMP
jgi:hypothetical protein